ncbi:MAG: YihY/virulence factor BrkB family protein [Chromatiaceae bacterium]
MTQPLETASPGAETLGSRRPDQDLLGRLAMGLPPLPRALVRDFTQGQLGLRAMGLAYTTLLSLVPLLAVIFSVLKGFGVHNRVEPLLLEALVPLGQTGEIIGTQLILFVENAQVAVLGTLGLVFLIYTSVSLIEKTEEAFNYIWHVARPRSLTNRFSHYLTVILITPVLFLSASGLAGSIRASVPFTSLLANAHGSSLIALVGWMIPYLLLAAAFTFIYVSLPHTQVQFRPALIAALVTVVLWRVTGWGFTYFMVGSTHFTAIYSGFAIPILFMMWVHIAWLILLAGASLAFYLQHPEYLATADRDARPSCQRQERWTLAVVGQVVHRHYHGESPWDSDSLAHALALPRNVVRNQLEMLEAGGYLVPTAGEPSRYVPSRAPDTISLISLLEFARGYPETLGTLPTPPAPTASAIEIRLDEARYQALSGLTLKDLADQLGTL